MEAALAELERRQTGILERISKLERSLPPDAPTTTAVVSAISNSAAFCDIEARLSNILRSNGVNNFSFRKVPSDYYDCLM
ncbi:hypothetical protein SLEP1_g46013 [Rubroshorea leprosula]|uniref:Uncharacterized protein n=1 Tax=Rubroshorea leprosula TaxID=152421 RepID=A0AAV5LMF9_9ROSI|nr:hypothetical protein SLEP1_g46013 [Rubroshorea leprosula]